jgi:hypothetical protein
MPSGAIDDCGSRPSVLATSFASSEWMTCPFSRTRPCDGFSIRDRARRRADLPQAFGPTITVIKGSTR